MVNRYVYILPTIIMLSMCNLFLCSLAVLLNHVTCSLQHFVMLFIVCFAGGCNATHFRHPLIFGISEDNTSSTFALKMKYMKCMCI